MTNGNEPELSGQRLVTGHEPELSNARPKCGEGHTMQKNLAGGWVCMTCMRTYHRMGLTRPVRARLERDPQWFNAASKSVGEQQIRNVRMGRHPMGSALLNEPGATCGNCALSDLQGNVGGKYHKCYHPDHDLTGGPATDIRTHWPACEHWSQYTDDGPAGGLNDL